MSLKNFEENITVYYSKRTGEIQTFCTGIQDMSLFGNNAEDYELIWDFLIVPNDDFVLKNLSYFYVDLITKEIVLKPTTKMKFNDRN